MTNVSLLCSGIERTTGKTYVVESHESVPRPLYEVSCLESLDELDGICESAQEGYEEWSEFTYANKIEVLKKATEILKSHRDDFMKLFAEIGLPDWFVHFNADQLVNQLDDYISQISSPLGEVLQTQVTEFAYTVREPIGPVLAIAPWNAPGVLIGRTISAPLAAGCSVILKSSELAPKSAHLWVQCLHEAGVPKKALQLVNLVPSDNEEGVSRIIGNRNIKKVSFTGSTNTGRAIATVAAKNLKSCVLELGGKNYSIIEDDADLSKAIGATLWASWGHKGQICMSTDRIFVHESIYDKFIKVLKELAPQVLKSDEGYYLPQRTSTFTKRILSLVEDALKKGAHVIYGETTALEDNKNTAITPLVLGGVTKDMAIDDTEIFGPIVCVHKYTDSSKLVRELNKSPYGLKTSIWTKNTAKAQKLARVIESGGVHINSATIYDEPTAPHGGVKESGYGRFNSKWGIDEFSYVKTISLSE